MLDLFSIITNLVFRVWFILIGHSRITSMRLLRAVSPSGASNSEDLNGNDKSSCFNAPTGCDAVMLICTTMPKTLL